MIEKTRQETSDNHSRARSVIALAFNLLMVRAAIVSIMLTLPAATRGNIGELGTT